MSLSDAELQKAVKGTREERNLTTEAQKEMEALASNPYLLELENAHRYESQAKAI